MKRFSEILTSPEYRAMPNQDQIHIRRQYYQALTREPDFLKLSPIDRQDVTRRILNPTVKAPTTIQSPGLPNAKVQQTQSEAPTIETAAPIAETPALDASPNQLSASEIVNKIESQQNPEYFDKSKITKQVGKAGEIYIKIQLDPNDLKVPGEKSVEPGVSAPDKGAIITDDKGKVIDGRHRVIDAKAAGETAINAYVPGDSILEVMNPNMDTSKPSFEVGQRVEADMHTEGKKAGTVQGLTGDNEESKRINIKFDDSGLVRQVHPDYVTPIKTLDPVIATAISKQMPNLPNVQSEENLNENQNSQN